MRDIIAPDEWFQREVERGNGVFERGNLEKALEYVEGWDVALDVGAHCGSWSWYMAERFKSVMAFEPDVRNYRFLVHNSPNSMNVNAAIGEQEGFCSMVQGERNSGQAWVKKVQNSVTEGHKIPVITIDGLGVDPDFIKIDVEGFELSVLRGAVKTLERCSPVLLFEVNGLSDRYGVSYEEIAGFLSGLGYKKVDKKKYDEIWKK